MVIPEERDGKTDAAVQLDRDPSKPSNVVSTRQAGGREPQISENRKVRSDVGKMSLNRAYNLHKVSSYIIIKYNYNNLILFPSCTM